MHPELAKRNGFYWKTSDAALFLDTETLEVLELGPCMLPSSYGCVAGAGTQLSKDGNWGIVKALRETSVRKHTYIFEYRYCNRKCPYCSGMCFPDGRYAEESAAGPTFPEPVPGASEANVVICGGEPFIDDDFATKVDEWLERNRDGWHTVCVLTAVNFRTLKDRKLFAVLAKWKALGKSTVCSVTMNGYPQFKHGHQVWGTPGWGYALDCCRELKEAGHTVAIQLLANSNTMSALADVRGYPVSIFSIQHLNEHNYAFSKRIEDSVFETAQAEHNKFHCELQFDFQAASQFPDLAFATDFGVFSGRRPDTSTKIAWDAVYPFSAAPAWNYWPHGNCSSCPARTDDKACLETMAAGCDAMYGHHCLVCPAFKLCSYSKPGNTNCCDKNGLSFCDNIRRDIAAALALRFWGLSADEVRGLLAPTVGCSP